MAAAGEVPAPRRKPRLMGVVNVTPDSFSDGGRWLDPGLAREHGLRLVAEGAALLDVGGESTRPGAAPVAVEEELRRVLPVVAALAREARVPISIDTTKAAVAAAALDAGATLVNDVSAGRFDPDLLPLAAARGATVVLMHMQGTPRDMQLAPRYGDVVAEVEAFLRERAGAAAAAGLPRERVWLDPGIGFGKTLEHNLALLRALPRLRALGHALLVGVSRKAFLATIRTRAGAPPEPAAERLGATAAAVAHCALNGADVLRVHDVAAMAQAVDVALALADVHPDLRAAN